MEQPVSIRIESDFLGEEYVWYNESTDRSGCRIQKGDDLNCLGNPVILYGKDDFDIPKIGSAWERDREVIYSFNNVEKAASFIKDEGIRNKFLVEGGVFTNIDDWKRGFVALLWIGKTEKEVDKIIQIYHNESTLQTAKENLLKSVDTLIKFISKDDIINMVNEALVKNVLEE